MPQEDALHVMAAMQTDPGCVRSQNEDTVAYTLAGNEDPVPGRRLLALVADGVGGHAAGEIASRIAADTVLNVYYETAGSPGEVLRMCLNAANKAILERGRTDVNCTGMGTTCTVLALSDSDVWLAHIGDSRAYLLRGNVLQQISEDHSLVADMVRGGTITPEEAAVSPRRNVISRALGIDETIEPFIVRDQFFVGDRFVLCSDGLTDVVDDETIRQAVMELSPTEACKALIVAALEGGGPDNVSVGVFAVELIPTVTPEADIDVP
jgi:protein phosphatase